MATNTNIAERVRKLLDKAEDAAVTPEEAQTFAAKAAELIGKYNLDAPCVACHRVGIEGQCPGVKAHAYAQQVRLSIKIRLRPLEVALFTLPPGMAPEQCSGEIFAQIQNWRR